ncbi:MAG TPA: hypothetical protein VJ810_28100 [Blastocatellia bacterium]|nr:hypothetical protein [Blastocatellia bacterium]
MVSSQRYWVWGLALALSALLPFWSALSLELEPFKTMPPAPTSLFSEKKPTAPNATRTPAPLPDSRSGWRQIPFDKIIVGLYLLFLLYRLRNLWRAWRLTLAIGQSATPVIATAAWREVLEYCRTKLGVGEAALFSSPSVMVPVTLGLWHPRIILSSRWAKSIGA